MFYLIHSHMAASVTVYGMGTLPMDILVLGQSSVLHIHVHVVQYPLSQSHQHS